jgi:UDP-N-acetyl-D-galactosamine dehydrogenase
MMKPPFSDLNTCTVAVIGLAYVGLPLAMELAKHQDCARTGIPLKRRVIGFDINQQRLSDLVAGVDRTNEISLEELASAEMLTFTSDSAGLATADVFVVTVPTPIDSSRRPNLIPLEKASSTVGEALKARDQRQQAEGQIKKTLW